MAKLTEAQCKARGLNWNPRTKSCTMPDISNIKMGIGRGDGCDGTTRIVRIRRRLPLAVRLVLIKAVKGQRGTPSRGGKKRASRRAKSGS
jgi:hypothetical protein